MILITIITLYPVWFSLINSLNSASAIAKHGYAMLIPDEFSTASWQAVLKNNEIVKAFLVTLARTIIVTAGQTVITSMFAYGFSRNYLCGKTFYATIGTWNDYTQTLYYTRSTDLQTLSYYMLTVIKSSQTAENMSKMGTAASSVLSTMSEQASNYKTIELACMVLSSIPLIVMYPFAQKFFEKGLMVGSVKG